MNYIGQNPKSALTNHNWYYISPITTCGPVMMAVEQRLFVFWGQF
jgi:hypothetical protein